MRRWRAFFSMFVVLLIFIGFCFYYLKAYVVTKPHGIIVFIAPGIDPETLALARIRSKESKFLWFGRKGSGTLSLVDSQCYRDRFAELPAILTTLATGKFSNNGYLGIDSQERRVDTLLYAAQRAGRMVGLVTSGRITSPGVAAFYANTTDASNECSVLRTLLDAKINVMIGGGTPAFEEYKALGGGDLLKTAEEQGYILANTREQLQKVPSWLTLNLKLLAIMGRDRLPTQQEKRILSQNENQSLPLAELVASAIECLQYNIGGYFLVVEDPLIAQAATRNQSVNVADQLLNLDWAIATARAYAGEKAEIFVYSPQSIGGMQITGVVGPNLPSSTPKPYFPQESNEFYSTCRPSSLPPVSWHNGPGGAPAVPAPEALLDPIGLPQDPAWLYRPEGALPSAGYGLLFVSGPGLERTPVMMDVRELHDLLRKQF